MSSLATREASARREGAAAKPPTRRTLAALLLAALMGAALTACGPSEPRAESAQAEGLTHVSQASHEAHDTPDAPDAHDHHAHDHHAHHEELGAGPLPGTSIYHLTTSFTDHHERQVALPDLRGAPTVFVMFYGDCTTACPLLVRYAEQIEAALPEGLAGETQFVMVSFDTERDTPARLLAYAEEKGLDKANWHWLVGTPLQTRQLATLLGVQYRDAGNGMFAHSNLITVVDADGVPTARLEGLGIDLQPAVAAIEAAGAHLN